MMFAEVILWKRRRAGGPLAKVICMCEDGGYLGVKATTEELIVGDMRGVWLSRTVRRTLEKKTTEPRYSGPDRRSTFGERQTTIPNVEWDLERRRRGDFDQVQSACSRHLSKKEFVPTISRTSSARFQKVVPKLTTTKNKPVTRRNEQACRKPNKYKHDTRKGCARKHVKCLAQQQNHSGSSFVSVVDSRR